MNKKDRAASDSAKVNQHAANMDELSKRLKRETRRCNKLLLLNQKFADALSELLGSCELNMDDMDPETLLACANARVLIAQLNRGGNRV